MSCFRHCNGVNCIRRMKHFVQELTSLDIQLTSFQSNCAPLPVTCNNKVGDESELCGRSYCSVNICDSCLADLDCQYRLCLDTMQWIITQLSMQYCKILGKQEFMAREVAVRKLLHDITETLPRTFSKDHEVQKLKILSERIKSKADNTCNFCEAEVAEVWKRVQMVCKIVEDKSSLGLEYKTHNFMIRMLEFSYWNSLSISSSNHNNPMSANQVPIENARNREPKHKIVASHASFPEKRCHIHNEESEFLNGAATSLSSKNAFNDCKHINMPAFSSLDPSVKRISFQNSHCDQWPNILLRMRDIIEQCNKIKLKPLHASCAINRYNKPLNESTASSCFLVNICPSCILHLENLHKNCLDVLSQIVSYLMMSSSRDLGLCLNGAGRGKVPVGKLIRYLTKTLPKAFHKSARVQEQLKTLATRIISKASNSCNICDDVIMHVWILALRLLQAISKDGRTLRHSKMTLQVNNGDNGELNRLLHSLDESDRYSLGTSSDKLQILPIFKLNKQNKF